MRGNLLKKLALTLMLLFSSWSAWAAIPGQLSGQFRTVYFNRTFTPLQESMAAGGWLQYNSPAWQGINFNLVGYTSQGLLFTDPAHGGGGILTPSQESFSVLGQANIAADLGCNRIIFFRQALDTPFINTHDIRMTPKLFEALTLTTRPSSRATFQAAQISRIKGWGDRDFVPMSRFAGFPGTDKGVTMAGIMLSPSDRLQVQAWNYYCWDFMNVVYAQADGNFAIRPGLVLAGSLQSFLQQSVGQAMGGNFSTGTLGIKGAFQWDNGLNAVLAYTTTGKGHNIVNPSWGSYAGFTSIIEEDSDLAGEQGWTVGLENSLCRLGPGNLAGKLYHTEAFISGNGSFARPSQYETDLLLEYKLAANYYWRLRGAVVSNALDMGGLNYSSLRLSVHYDL